MREPITVGMLVFVHSNAETHEPVSWEWFSVTGENLPFDLIEYLMDDVYRNEDLDVFSNIETDITHYAILVFEFEEGDSSVGLPSSWYIANMIGYHRIPVPEYFQETPDSDRQVKGLDF